MSQPDIDMAQIRNMSALAEEYGGRLVYLKYAEGEQGWGPTYLATLHVVQTPEDVEATVFVLSIPGSDEEVVRFMVMDEDLEWLLANRV